MALKRCLGCGTLIDAGSRCRSCDPQRSRGRPWARLREHILARDSHTCQECGRPADAVDHIMPLSQGGTDAPANLQALCTACNTDKAAK